MAVLLPRAARLKLAAAAKDIDDGTLPQRTITEIANYAQLPDFYVDIWLQMGTIPSGSFAACSG